MTKRTVDQGAVNRRLRSELDQSRACERQLQHKLDALAQARNEWLAALDRLEEPVFMHDEQFNIVHANDAYVRRAGMSLADLTGRPYWQAFPKRDGPLPGCARGLDSQAPSEERFAATDGTVYRSRAFVVRDLADGARLSAHILEDITQHERTQTHLYQLRAAVDATGEGVVVCDADAVITYVNPALTRMVGRNEHDLIGRPMHALYAPGDVPKAQQIHAQTLTQANWSGEINVLDGDGQGLPVYLNTAPIHDPDRGPIGWVATYTDARRLKLEQQRSEQLRLVVEDLAGESDLEAMAQRALEHAVSLTAAQIGGIAVLDENENALRYRWTRGLSTEGERIGAHVVLQWGQGAAGYAAQQGQSVQVDDYAHADLAHPRFVELGLTAVAAAPVFVNGEVGAVISVGSTIGALPDSGQTLPYLEAIAGQLGAGLQRQRLTDALADSEARLRRIVDTVPDILFILRLPDLAPEFVSPAAETLLGYAPAEVTADSTLWLRLIHPEDKERVLGEIEVAAQHEEVFQTETRFVHRDGHTVRWFQHRGRFVRDAHGNPVQLLGVLADISARKNTEQQLTTTTRELGERVKELTCLRNISHLRADPRLSIDDVLRRCVEQLPPAFQFPELACARIVWGETSYDTRDFQQSRWRLTAPLTLDGHAQGHVEVNYRADPGVDQTFLAEEKSLLEAVGTDLGLTLERHRAQGALAESEQRLRTVAEMVPEVLYSARLPDYDVVYISPRVESILGYPPQMFLGSPKAWISRVHAPDRSWLLRTMTRLVGNAKPGPHMIEYRIRTPDNTDIRWVADHFQIECDDSGNPTTIHGAVSDITERKVDQAALHYRAQLLDSVRESIVATDLNGTVVHWGRGAQQLYGYDADEAIGRPIDSVVGSQDPEAERQRLQQVLEAGRWAGEHRRRRKDGSPFWADTAISLVRDERQEPIGFVGIDRDITEQRRHARQLQDLNRVLATVSACNEALVRATDEAGLLQAICSNIVQHGGYSRAWVALLSDGRLEPVAEAGGDGFAVAELVFELDDTAQSPPPPVAALRDGERISMNIDEPEFAAQPWAAQARDFGIGAWLCLPMDLSEQARGVLNVCSPKAGRFTSDEIEHLGELADDLAYGVRALRAREAANRAEKALCQSEERFRTVIQSESDGVVVVDEQARVLLMNPAAQRLLGRYAEQTLGTDFGLPVATGEITELSVATPDGGSRSLEMRAAPVDWLGQPASIVSLHDITERKQLESERSAHADQLQRTLVQTIEAMALAMEKRDPYTAGHQRRVASVAVAIAAELGMEPARIQGLRMGALIHDVGKIYIPAEILARPGRLTEPEFQLIKSHPEVGYAIIKEVDFAWPVAEMILQHHERLDGSGYPRGLKGDEISMEAQILAVADVVEAMVSHRPYRPGLGVDAALEELRKRRGTELHAGAVDACVRLFTERGFAFD